MDDPYAGWKVLTELLRPGGFMRIGLYSRAGRTRIAAAQEAARRGQYVPTRDGILRFRRECAKHCDRATILCLSALKDYYHLNMYRDLLFPAVEHRFDVFQIQWMLTELQLSFDGFYVSDDVLRAYRAMFNGDRNATNLSHWARFETQHPDTFANMYIFSCSKGASRR
jgi:hypothetical protein